MPFEINYMDTRKPGIENNTSLHNIYVSIVIIFETLYEINQLDVYFCS